MPYHPHYHLDTPDDGVLITDDATEAQCLGAEHRVIPVPCSLPLVEVVHHDNTSLACGRDLLTVLTAGGFSEDQAKWLIASSVELGASGAKVPCRPSTMLITHTPAGYTIRWAPM